MGVRKSRDTGTCPDSIPGKVKAPGKGERWEKLRNQNKPQTPGAAPASSPQERLQRARMEPGRKKFPGAGEGHSGMGSGGMSGLRLGLPRPTLSKIFQSSLWEVRLEVARSLSWPSNNPEGREKQQWYLWSRREELRCHKFSQTPSRRCKNSSGKGSG